MIRTARTCFAVVLALGIVSGPSRPLAGQSTKPPDNSAAVAFPLGTYTNCAQGTFNPSGNEFQNASGFQDGARLTLAQNGITLTSTYVDQNGLTQSLSLTATTHAPATIARKGQSIPGFRSLCVVGPGTATGYPANMTVTAGALIYDAGIVFLNVVGDLRSDAGSCGALSQSHAAFWLACENPRTSAPRSADAQPAPLAQLPAGRYSCRTQLDALAHINGRNEYTGGGATGTLMLTDHASKVTARYSGDPSLAGTLRFTATAATTASAEAGQILMAPCFKGAAIRQASQTPEPMPIAAGSLSILDSTLFLSFAGTMADNSSCPGAEVAGSLICTK